MKKSPSSVLLTAVVLAAYVLSACGAAPAASADPSSPAGLKVQAIVVAFTGQVESMNGNQWVVDGQTLTVEPKSLPDANIQVGDLVKVEGTVGRDGAITTTRVASPMAFTGFAPAANQVAYPDPTETPNPSATPQANEQEVSGVIEAMTDTSVTIDGITYLLTNLSEVQGLLAVGDQVKIHFIANPDGSLTIREIELFTNTNNDNSNGNGNENGNVNSNGNDNSNVNSNDNDNGNVNSNDNDNDNVNSNDNDNDDDDNANVNSNDDDSNSNDNANDNGNENDDDSNSNTNDNSNGNENGNDNGNGNGG